VGLVLVFVDVAVVDEVGFILSYVPFGTCNGLLVTVIDLLTPLGQICFFFVNTSQYSLVAVLQKILGITLINTGFWINIIILIRSSIKI
jgi:hypothetical protein